VHSPANFSGRHPFAFKSHNPASMGKMLIPGDIIMQAFMAGDVHGCWVLVTGYSMLDTRYWMLDAGKKGTSRKLQALK